MSLPNSIIIAIVAVVVVLVLILLLFLTRYKKCRKGKAIVVYGAKLGYNADGTPKNSKVVYGGAVFVLPFIQSYEYLDITPISVNIESKNIITNKDERVNVSFAFKFCIPNKDDYLKNAAERLLGLSSKEVQELAEDLATTEINNMISNWDSHNIEKDKFKISDQITENLSNTLKKIGLIIQRANLTDFYTVKNN